MTDTVVEHEATAPERAQGKESLALLPGLFPLSSAPRVPPFRRHSSSRAPAMSITAILFNTSASEWLLPPSGIPWVQFMSPLFPQARHQDRRNLMELKMGKWKKRGCLVFQLFHLTCRRWLGINLRSWLFIQTLKKTNGRI